MAETVYRNYGAEALYAQYNNRAMVAPDVREAHKAEQSVRTEAFVAASKRVHPDLAYGPGARERLDLFLPQADAAPLLAYLHGGYWQWNDKEPFAFLGEQLIPAGAAFANIEYTLCPDVSLSELTNQARRAIAYLWREAGQFGYDRGRIVVCGHSAGGQLTAMMMATDWPGFAGDLPTNVVAAGLPISGIYDLEPIRLTPLNDLVGMDTAEARAQSPMFMAPPTKAPMVVVAGGAESEEFIRQAEDFAARWREHGVAAESIVPDGLDHFTVLDTLAEADHAVYNAAARLLGLS
jgi:arylformamidase